MKSTCLVGGIEGGATHSTVVLLNAAGEVVVKIVGPSSNHYLVGMEECCKRIADMISDAKKQAKADESMPLEALGLSLSGVESEQVRQEMTKCLEKTYPRLSKHYVIGSDTDGAIAATSNKGGVVCIAGTGSNTLLINPDGTRAQCGGWGYILGDEGSAWWVSLKAVKICFHHLDQFEAAPHPIEKLWNYIKSFFGIEYQPDILDHFYKTFEKAQIAHLCKGMAELATEGDMLSQHIFEEAGRDLAKSVAAVYKSASTELTTGENGLQVLCVGSVWLSWSLLEKGFVGYLRTKPQVKKLSLLRLKVHSGVGAAYMAADGVKFNLQRDYSQNYDVFFKYDQKHSWY